MESTKPKYLDTWKGKVLKAMAVDGGETWRELQSFTQLSTNALKKAIGELIKYKIIRKREGRPTKYIGLNEEIFQAYRNYYNALALSHPLDEKLPEQESSSQIRTFILSCLYSTQSECISRLVSLLDKLSESTQQTPEQLVKLILQDLQFLQQQLIKIQTLVTTRFPVKTTGA